MQNNNTEVVYLPSATRPGTRFVGFTSAAIRQRNIARWRRTEQRYRDAKESESFLSHAVKAAFDTAQAGSLINRSVVHAH